MDTFSHAGWGYAASKHKRMPWWGALAGAMPDLLFFIPSRIEMLVEHGLAGLTSGRDPAIWRADGPPLPPDLVEAYWRYYVWSHSLVVLGAVTAAVLMTRFRRWAWLAVPYALHILMDLPTHERYEGRPFYPLSDWYFIGVTWGDPRIFFPNVIALLVTLWFVHRRSRAVSQGS
ncbi:MAG: hypothetical protein M3R55_17475 [Acidobacteriota bacterium]|nr:hypothetical protein [Acidobacteriota bacterium]